jgi:hypothetical protein
LAVVKIGPRAYHVALSGVSLWSEALGFGNIKVRPFFWGDGRSMVSGVDVVVAPLFLLLSRFSGTSKRPRITLSRVNKWFRVFAVFAGKAQKISTQTGKR